MFKGQDRSVRRLSLVVLLMSRLSCRRHKQLEALCATAAFGSFTEASKRLIFTQSTIAKRVGELESSVGARLFHRDGKSLHLTAVGEQLLSQAQEMMALHERITETLRKSHNSTAACASAPPTLSALPGLQH
jgi:DNA-binding transcriptional LysR family regulator